MDQPHRDEQKGMSLLYTLHLPLSVLDSEISTSRQNLFSKYSVTILCCCVLQISLLDTAVNHLKANIKSASDLISLPTTVEELQKVKLALN